MAIKIPKKVIDVTGIELTPKEAFQKKEKKEINAKEAASFEAAQFIISSYYAEKSEFFERLLE